MHLSWDEVLADRERDAARKQGPPGPWEGAGPWAWRVWPRGGEHVHRPPGLWPRQPRGTNTSARQRAPVGALSKETQLAPVTASRGRIGVLTLLAFVEVRAVGTTQDQPGIGKTPG